MKPDTHHARLVPCRECARLALLLRIAKREKRRKAIRKLIMEHRLS